MKKYICMFLSFILASCSSTKFLKTVEKVDIDKYSGTWYEIARFEHTFEKGLKCVTANYTAREDGKIKVLNRGVKETDLEVKTAEGKAWVPDANFPGRLKVSFFWPFAGDYYIVHLDEDYKYVLVGAPNRDYLWILSRTKILDEKIYNELLDVATENGFDVSKLNKVAQDCE
ncbi:MAG: lipocalin family protein [Candidatus Delongbacteria bacterium]|jgi:apolipoprotein D and lipocalin family protein|nr:lipocalin family protein [Candidatus Delongbacteria bacterium]